MIFLYISLGIIAFAFLLYLFLVFPSGRKKKTAEFFEGRRLYAHRGLHGNGVPENSLAAFELACKAGYGIEFDVHITADGELSVFHDDTLARMCGVEGKTEDKTLEQLRALKLAGTEEHIPSLREVLDLIDGRVPLVIEIKGTKISDTRVCELTAQMLDTYKGVFCIESFNPIYVRWWKKHRKSTVRGQLSSDMKKGNPNMSNVVNFFLTNLLLSFLARPDFIAYDVSEKHRFSFRFARARGGYPVAWTIRTEDDKKASDGDFKAIIFENIRP